MKGSARRAAWLVPTLAVSFFAMTSPADASCAEPVPIGRALADADTVFVGTVTGLEHDDRVATFEVEEIWKGDVGVTVTVTGGPTPSEIDRAAGEGLMVVTSVDRTYVAGRTYLVVSHGADGEVLLDNNCSATQIYDTTLDRFRPDTAQGPPVPVGTADGPPFWVWSVFGLIAVGAIGGTAVPVTRRVRHRRSSDPVLT